MYIPPRVLIGAPSCKIYNSQFVVEFPVRLNDKQDILWYAVDEKYKDFVCTETADGVVVSFLSYAMRGGYDIESELPISKKLHLNLTNTLIPQIYFSNKDVHHTRIFADTIELDFTPLAVATAMSCGVDSLNTFYDYTSENCFKDYKLTHLTYYQNGAHHGGHIGYNDVQEEVFSRQVDQIKKFCNDVAYPLIIVRSNIDKFLSNFFWKDSYHLTHTYRNAGFSLLLQKGIKIYYISPGPISRECDFSLVNDPSFFDLFLIPNLQTELISISIAATNLSRIEKIKYISNFKEAKKHLNVCYNSGKNCGVCVKCFRTIVAIDTLGLIDEYKECFDISDYLNKRDYYLSYHCSLKYHDKAHREIYYYGKNHGFKIPTKIIIKGYLKYLKQRFNKK